MSIWDWSLESVLGLDWRERDKVNPDLVAARFRSAEGYSDAPSYILRHTVDKLDLRSKLTPEDIRTTYENGIKRAVSQWGVEAPAGPIAHVVLKYVQDDPRLAAAVSPDYIHGRFQEAMRKENLDEAYYLFQSTVLSETGRAAFSPDDVHALFQLARKNDSMFFVNAILETTLDDPRSRTKLTPAMIGESFRASLQLAQADPRSESHYAYQAVRMLGLTIGDNRLRSDIADADIDKLVDHYREIAAKPDSPFGFNKVDKQIARQDIDLINAYRLRNPDKATVRRLFTRFSRIAGRRDATVVDMRRGREAVRFVQRYPAMGLKAA